MNEQLQAALAEMLGKANAGIDAGATFLQAQLPDVIQQLLMWKMVASLLYFVLGILLLSIVAISMRAYRRVRDEEKGDGWRGRYKMTLVFDSDGDMHPGVIPVIVGQALGVIVGLACFDLTWLQIWIAPKIYLIEYAASLAK